MQISLRKDGLSRLISFIESSPEINIVGIKQRIRKTLSDRTNLEKREYQELNRIYRTLHPEINQMGILRELYEI
jgi:hypothetical protein